MYPVTISEEQRLLVNRLGDFLKKELVEEDQRYGDIEMEAEVARALLKRLVPMGYLEAGNDLTTTMILLEELSRVFPSLTGIVIINELCIRLLQDWVPPDPADRFIEGTKRGELIGCIAVSEPDVGSDPTMIQAQAVRQGDQWVINGRKTWISNGHISDYCILYAQTDPSKGKFGIQAILVDRLESPYESRDIKTIGLRGFPCSELYFEDCKVPLKNTLVIPPAKSGQSPAREISVIDMLVGKGILFPLLGWSLISTGLAQRAFEIARYHVKTRRQFGKEIGRFQLVQEMIVDMATRIDCARLLTYRAVHLLKERPCALEVSMAKTYATEMAIEVTSKAIQCMGAIGLSEDARVERCLRDARMMTMPDGTTQLQKLRIGRELIGLGAVL